MSDRESPEAPATGKTGTVGGGRSDRGPEPDPGGEVASGGLVPPYEGRSTERGSSESAEALTESIEQQLETTKSGNVGATASPAEEHAVQPEELGDPDDAPESPHGVGESTTRRGEDVRDDEGKEPGRRDTGVDDTPGQRPHGTSTARDLTGVDPQDPQTD
jgi:hypothetical protein